MKKHLLDILIISIFPLVLFACSIISAQNNQLADEYWNKAKAIEKQGKYLEAAKIFEEYVQVEKASPSPRMANSATGLNKVGNCFYRVGQFDKAIKYYEEALAIFKKLEQEDNVAKNLSNIGLVYDSLGQYYKAIKYYNEALAIDKKLDQEAGVAIDLGYIGGVYYTWGQYYKAINYYKEALAINKKLGRNTGVATVLNNIGLVYYSWSKHDKAIKYFKKALTIDKKLGLEPEVANSLSNIGLVYVSWNQYDKAIKYFKEALAIARKLGQENTVAVNLSNIGFVYRSWGQYDEAINYYEKALAINKKLRLEADVPAVLNNIGRIYVSLGQYDKAIKYYEKALAFCKILGRKTDIAGTLNNIGMVYDSFGQYRKAIKYYEEAVSIKEILRKTAAGNVRINYLASQLHTYQSLASAHIRNSDVFSAFQTIELSRAKLLAERLTGDESKIRLPDVKQIQETLGNDTVILVYANVDQGDIVQIQIAITRKEITGKEVSSESFAQSSIDKFDKRIKTLLKNQHVIKVSQKKNKEQTLLKSTEVKNDFDNVVNYYRSLLKGERGLKKVFRDSSENRKIKTRELGRKLYELLIKPMKPQIKGKKNLIIVPDGILAFVPFETLIDDKGKYLAENYHISYVQSMGILKLIKERKYKEDRKPLLAFGGAVYDEVTYDVDMIRNDKQLALLTKKVYSDIKGNRSVRDAYGALGIGTWTNLPGTLSEVNNIKRVVKKSDVFTGRNVTEKDVKALSRNRTLSDYKVLHFATHGLVVPEMPELSAIVLSQFKSRQGNEDGYLRMGEIAELDIRADFVNLSACETGLGKIYGGEGVVGLTQSFLLAGANAVSVSLWSVADKSTSQFMVSMYDMVYNKNLTYADAMTEVKRQFINGDFGVKYKEPYYWAPFVYYGKDDEENEEQMKLATGRRRLDGVKRLTDEKKSLPKVTSRQDNLEPTKEHGVTSDWKIKNLTKNEVLQKLRKPDSIYKWATTERWNYGHSYIEFENAIFVRCYDPDGTEGLNKWFDRPCVF